MTARDVSRPLQPSSRRPMSHTVKKALRTVTGLLGRVYTYRRRPALFSAWGRRRLPAVWGCSRAATSHAGPPTRCVQTVRVLKSLYDMLKTMCAILYYIIFLTSGCASPRILTGSTCNNTSKLPSQVLGVSVVGTGLL